MEPFFLSLLSCIVHKTIPPHGQLTLFQMMGEPVREGIGASLSSYVCMNDQDVGSLWRALPLKDDLSWGVVTI